MMECGVREFTLEEEIEIYKKEAKELFDNEQEGCETPFVNCIVRRGMRIISKSKEIREKFTPKKPIKLKAEQDIEIGAGTWKAGITVYKCPCCNSFISRSSNFCSNCGQAIKQEDL